MEAAGHHRLAYYALVAAVPVAAVAALAAFAVALDRAATDHPADRAAPALSALAVPLLLLAAAVRAPVVGEVPPRVGVTALVACLVVLCLEAALVALAALVAAPRPALESD